MRKLIDAVPTNALDARAADTAATVRRAMEERGTPIGMGDRLIAGIVVAAADLLLTRNVRHFEHLEGLRLSGRYED